MGQNNVGKTYIIKDSITGELTGSYTTVQLDSQILKYFRFPKNSDKLKSGKYKVYLSFLINEDNSISNLKVTEDPGYGIGQALKKALLKLALKEPEFFKKIKGDLKDWYISAPVTVFISN